MKTLLLLIAIAGMGYSQTEVIRVDTSGTAHISKWNKITVEIEGKTYTIESKEVFDNNWRGHIYGDSLKVDSIGRYPYVPYKWKLKTVPNLLKKV
jgi:hypothetical protein